MTSRFVQVSQFADDLALFCKVKQHKKCKNILQKGIETISRNLREIGLDLNASKTKFIHFNKNLISPGKTFITVNDVKIKSSLSVTFLGLTFDCYLSFKEHIREVSVKATKALNLIKFVCGIWWGSNPNTLMILYKSCI